MTNSCLNLQNINLIKIYEFNLIIFFLNLIEKVQIWVPDKKLTWVEDYQKYWKVSDLIPFIN